MKKTTLLGMMLAGLLSGNLALGQTTKFGEFTGYEGSGSNNDFFGYRTGMHNKGSENSFFGKGSGVGNEGSHNVGIGNGAGNVNKGHYNTFLGRATGVLGVGSYNIMVGVEAGWENRGSNNLFFGQNAGYKNKGNNNIFVGPSTGYGVNTGSDNIFMGLLSGNRNTSGYQNLFLGGFSGGYNTTGFANVALGYSASYLNEAGKHNVAIGHRAGFKNKNSYNIFIGALAGEQSENSSSSVIIGYTAGFRNAGADNTFIGVSSGNANTTGSENTFIGQGTGLFNTTGKRNVYIGANSGLHHKGSNNVFIGYDTGEALYDTVSNKLLIASSFNNSLIYGDFSRKKVSIGGIATSNHTLHVLGSIQSTGLFTSSDKRFKKNIQPIEGAREKLLAVNGVSYEFKEDKERLFQPGKTYGFIAQDVQQVMPALVKQDQDGYLSLNYDCFIPLLVEGYKDLATENKELKDKNANLEARLTALEKKLGGKRHRSIDDMAADSFSGEKTIVLYQNKPNPFSESTVIAYEVLQEASQISLHIYDMSGQELLSFANLAAGKHSVTLRAGQIPAGMYLYSLLVDGEIQDTKRMILTK